MCVLTREGETDGCEQVLALLMLKVASLMDLESRGFRRSEPFVESTHHCGLSWSFVQGFLYVLDFKGQTKEGWPLQMGEIQAQVAVADLRGDGSLVVVAADARGNVAAFDPDAQELWERHLGTLVAQVDYETAWWSGREQRKSTAFWGQDCVAESLQNNWRAYNCCGPLKAPTPFLVGDELFRGERRLNREKVK